MTEVLPDGFFLEKIFHPTDFSHGSETAFVHALKLAVQANALLEILHVNRHPERVRWDDFPQVRETLAEWGLLPEGALPDDVSQLGIGIHKHLLGGDAPVDAISDHLHHSFPDVVVLATHHREGLDRWLHRDIAKRLARISQRICLFVPHNVDGFVCCEDGSAEIQRIVVPIAKEPISQPAVVEALGMARLLKCDSVEATLIHVGNNDAVFESLRLPEVNDWTWEKIVEPGDPATQILRTARDRNADLIALTTEGRHGFLDALRGSTTEQVVREANCPILSVPVDVASADV